MRGRTLKKLLRLYKAVQESLSRNCQRIDQIERDLWGENQDKKSEGGVCEFLYPGVGPHKYDPYIFGLFVNQECEQERPPSLRPYSCNYSWIPFTDELVLSRFRPDLLRLKLSEDESPLSQFVIAAETEAWGLEMVEVIKQSHSEKTARMLEEIQTYVIRHQELLKREDVVQRNIINVLHIGGRDLLPKYTPCVVVPVGKDEKPTWDILFSVGPMSHNYSSIEMALPIRVSENLCVSKARELNMIETSNYNIRRLREDKSTQEF